MPRDGDPMSQASSRHVPALFHGHTAATVDRAFPSPGAKPRRPPRPGGRAILLSVANQNGGSLLLAFSRTRGGIDFWRSLSPERSRLHHVATFPGRFSSREVARLLASGAARPALDASGAGQAEVDGVDDLQANLLRIAWSRRDGHIDPRASTVLGLADEVLAGAAERTGAEGPEGLLALGGDIKGGNEAWLARWRPGIDADVDCRAAAEGAGEARRRRLRAFVEDSLLTLGRLPRTDETEATWDGAGVAGRNLGDRERRRLGIYQTGRVGKFNAWVRFWSAAESIGWCDFGVGPGWYWDVTNPDPGWIMSCTMGPYKAAEDAWSDARCLEEQGQ
jgi:hypothetical protein